MFGGQRITRDITTIQTILAKHGLETRERC